MKPSSLLTSPTDALTCRVCFSSIYRRINVKMLFYPPPPLTLQGDIYCSLLELLYCIFYYYTVSSGSIDQNKVDKQSVRASSLSSKQVNNINIIPITTTSLYLVIILFIWNDGENVAFFHLRVFVCIMSGRKEKEEK